MTMLQGQTGFTQSHWIADQSEPILNLTVGDVLQQVAQSSPELIALIEKIPKDWESLVGAENTRRQWTFAELYQDAMACAHWLLEKYPVGTHVCVWAPNVPEWVILQFGTALAGMVLVTANPALKAEELDYVLKKSQSKAVFYLDNFRGVDTAAAVESIHIDGLEKHSFTHWAAKLKQVQHLQTLPTVNPENAAQIQFTSGTTGNPKGALLRHKAIVSNAYYCTKRAGFDHETYICPMPLFHSAGSILSILGCYLTKSTVVLTVMFEPTLFLQAVAEEKGTSFAGVPTMLLAILQTYKQQPVDISSLKLVLSGGSSVPDVLTERMRNEMNCELFTVYGQTETSPVICQTHPSDSNQDKALTTGTPLWNAEVRIAHPETLEVMPIHMEGEVQVRGYLVLMEYFDQPEATEKTVLADGWLRSGDLGTMDERGYVKVTGRLKDMIIRGGENIYPAQIESILMKHEAVENVAVFGLPHEHWGEVVAASIKFKPEYQNLSPDELKTFCRQFISPQKTPEAWFSCSEFPLTGSGKVQKFKLQDLAKSGELCRI